MTLHRLSVLIEDLVEFGSSGAQRLGRKAIAMQRKGIGMTKMTMSPSGRPKIHVTTIVRDPAALKAIEARSRWKEIYAATRTVPESDVKNLAGVKESHSINPHHDWGSGKGWEVATDRYNEEMDKIHGRFARAAGFKPKI